MNHCRVQMAMPLRGRNPAAAPSRIRKRGLLWLIAVIASLVPTGAVLGFPSDGSEFTAINSKQFNGYRRVRLADGSFAPETFVFGEGGLLVTRSMSMYDPAIENLTFREIAGVLAQALAGQHYVATRDPETTKLLIVVFWGSTGGGVHATDGAVQDAFDYFNARLLGFESEVGFLGDTSGGDIRGHILREIHAAGLSEIEVDRYYVILRAYDFQAAWKSKKLTRLWETRFSLSERQHDLRRDLSGMATSAAAYFGQDSSGLVHTATVPEGRVTLGEPKVIEYIGSPRDAKDAPGKP